MAKARAEKNGYWTPECGHGEFDGEICDGCLLALSAHEYKESKCDGCRQCLSREAFDALRFDFHWKISVRTEEQRDLLIKKFKAAGFEASKDVFWHDYPGGAKSKGFTIAVTGKDKVLETIMHSVNVMPIAWSGV